MDFDMVRGLNCDAQFSTEIKETKRLSHVLKEWLNNCDGVRWAMKNTNRTCNGHIPIDCLIRSISSVLFHKKYT